MEKMMDGSVIAKRKNNIMPSPLDSTIITFIYYQKKNGQFPESNLDD